LDSWEATVSTAKHAFDALCEDAGRILDVFDPASLAKGETFELHGIRCALHFSEYRASVFLRCDLGEPETERETHALRRLLDIQTALFGVADAAFGRDPLAGGLFFMVRLPLPDGLPPREFADALTQFAVQACEWREGVLAGALIDYEREFEKFFPGAHA
jgi:hypothetical protein